MISRYGDGEIIGSSIMREMAAMNEIRQAEKIELSARSGINAPSDTVIGFFSATVFSVLSEPLVP